MLTHFARWTLAFALALAAQASIPGWAPAAMAASAPAKKCTVKSHQHTKVAATKPLKPGAQQGVIVIETDGGNRLEVPIKLKLLGQ